MKRRPLVFGVPIAIGGPWTARAQTSGMPPATRPIRIIVPYPAGGPLDAAARHAALARVTGADLNIVAHKGGAPAAQDFLGGHIQRATTGIPQALDMLAQGMARIVAVAGTPAAVLHRLGEAATAALRTPEMQRLLQGFGWSPLGNTAAEFRAQLEREAPVVAHAMRAAGVQPE